MEMGTSLMALGMLACGLIAVALAYEVLGHPQSGDKKAFRLAHKIFGYFFLAIFLLLFVGMLGRFASPSPFSTLGIVHAALALAVFVLLLSKLAIVLRYKKLLTHAFALGTTIFVLSFTLTMLVAGGKLGHSLTDSSPAVSEHTDTTATKLDWPKKMTSTEIKFVSLCGQCHPLGQSIVALSMYKTEQDWLPVIDRMRKKTDAISEEDGREIAGYLAQLSGQ